MFFDMNIFFFNWQGENNKHYTTFQKLLVECLGKILQLLWVSAYLSKYQAIIKNIHYGGIILFMTNNKNTYYDKHIKCAPLNKFWEKSLTNNFARSYLFWVSKIAHPNQGGNSTSRPIYPMIIRETY